MIQELQSAFYLLLDVLEGAENVSVVLLKPSDPSQTGQSSRQFVPMQNTEVGKTQREFAPGTAAIVKDQTEIGKSILELPVLDENTDQ